MKLLISHIIINGIKICNICFSSEFSCIVDSMPRSAAVVVYKCNKLSGMIHHIAVSYVIAVSAVRWRSADYRICFSDYFSVKQFVVIRKVISLIFKRFYTYQFYIRIFFSDFQNGLRRPEIDASCYTWKESCIAFADTCVYLFSQQIPDKFCFRSVSDYF